MLLAVLSAMRRDIVRGASQKGFHVCMRHHQTLMGRGSCSMFFLDCVDKKQVKHHMQIIATWCPEHLVLADLAQLKAVLLLR
jgi:hypothetical protein